MGVVGGAESVSPALAAFRPSEPNGPGGYFLLQVGCPAFAFQSGAGGAAATLRAALQQGTPPADRGHLRGSRQQTQL